MDLDLAFPLHTYLVQKNWEEVRKYLYSDDNDNNDKFEPNKNKNQQSESKSSESVSRRRSSSPRTGIIQASASGASMASNLGLIIFHTGHQHRSSSKSAKVRKDLTKNHYQSRSLSVVTKSVFTYPLHLACSAEVSAPIDIIKDILQADTSVCKKLDAQGRLPLHYILENGESQGYSKGEECQNIEDDDPTAEIVELLLAIYPDGAKVHEHHTRRLPIHIACSSIHFIKSGGLSNRVLRALLGTFPESLRHFDEDSGCTSLHLLCKVANSKSNLDMAIKMILLTLPETALLTDRQSKVPLHYATNQRFLCKKTIEVLLACRPEAAMVKDALGQLPIHYALMEKCDSNQTCNNDVIAHSQGLVVKELLNAHQRGAQVRDMNGMLPLSLACRNNAPYNAITELISAYSDAAKDQDCDNRLPLHWACHCKDVSNLVVEELLQVHEDGVLHEESKYGLLPLHVACRAGASEAIISVLLSACEKTARIVDNNGSLPIHYACHSSSPVGAIIALLLAFPHSASIKNRNGKSALDLAKLKSPIDHNIIEALTADPTRWSGSSVLRLIWDYPSASKKSTYNRIVSPSNSESTSTSYISETQAIDVMCVVCLERRACNVLYPCGHSCLCDECASPSKLDALNHICPICRCKFEGCVKIFGKVVYE